MHKGMYCIYTAYFCPSNIMNDNIPFSQVARSLFVTCVCVCVCVCMSMWVCVCVCVYVRGVSVEGSDENLDLGTDLKPMSNVLT